MSPVFATAKSNRQSRGISQLIGHDRVSVCFCFTRALGSQAKNGHTTSDEKRPWKWAPRRHAARDVPVDSDSNCWGWTLQLNADEPTSKSYHERNAQQAIKGKHMPPTSVRLSCYNATPRSMMISAPVSSRRMPDALLAMPANPSDACEGCP